MGSCVMVPSSEGTCSSVILAGFFLFFSFLSLQLRSNGVLKDTQVGGEMRWLGGAVSQAGKNLISMAERMRLK